MVGMLKATLVLLAISTLNWRTLHTVNEAYDEYQRFKAQYTNTNGKIIKAVVEYTGVRNLS